MKRILPGTVLFACLSVSSGCASLAESGAQVHEFLNYLYTTSSTVFQEDDPHYELRALYSGKDCPFYEEALKEIKERNPESLEEAYVANQLAYCRKDIKKPEAAIALFKRAIDLRAKIYGPNDDKTANIYKNLADYYAQLWKETRSEEKAEKAIKYYEVALEIYEIDPSSAKLEALMAFANFYEEYGQPENAEPLLVELADFAKRHHDPESANMLHNTALAFRKRNDHQKAEQYFRDALAFRKLYGRNNPDIPMEMQLIGQELLKQYKLEEAEEILLEAIEYYQKVGVPELFRAQTPSKELFSTELTYWNPAIPHETLGEVYYKLSLQLIQNNPDLMMYSQLGWEPQYTPEGVGKDFRKKLKQLKNYMDLSDHHYQKAATLYEELEKRYRNLDKIEDNTEYRWLLKYIGSIHFTLAKNGLNKPMSVPKGEYIKQLDTAQSYYLKAGTWNNSIYDRYLNFFSHSLQHRKKLIDIISEALEKERQTKPKDHPVFGEILAYLGHVHHELGNTQEAVKNYLAAQEVFDQSLKNKHWSKKYVRDLKIYAFAKLAKVYKDLEQPEGQLECELKMLEVKEQMVPPDEQQIAESWFRIGNLYAQLKKTKEERAAYEKALPFYEKTDDKWANRLFYTYATTLRRQGDFKQSFVYYKKSLERRKEALPADHPDIGHSYEGMAYASWKLKDYAHAKEYYNQAVAIFEKYKNDKKITELKQAIIQMESEV